ncbi:MAG TPA: hypothetical protein VFH24_08345 [Gemmatimonadales bacterium]|nr:hypothetical protein [Gemmatimonadales bacterium]
MRWPWLILTAAGMLGGALALPGGAPEAPLTGPESSARRLEVARLRAHFDSVDTELRDAETLRLSPAQRTARATLIDWLREYREAGQFPRNDRFPDSAMPFFRDSHGALCAMAYLIERSGRGDLVDRVASIRNNAFIVELADDPELPGWLDSVGLSVAEAARIQPNYGPDLEDEEVSVEYALSSILVSGTSLTTVALNLITPSRSTAWAGLVAGSVGVIAGVANLDDTGGNQTVAAANMLIGVGAMGFGLSRLFNPQPDPSVGGLSSQTAGSGKPLAIRPLVIPTSNGPRLGLAMHANF